MNPLPQRKSTRLKDYDYSEEGAYFVTICVQEKLKLFGYVEDGTLICNGAGEMVNYWWGEVANRFSDIQLDFSVVMPNHFHGIVCISRHDSKDSATSLLKAMQWFKTMTTNAYIRGVKNDGWDRYAGKLWQRSYHDHIIRNEADLNRIREYVLYNPTRWEADTYFE